MTDTIVRISPDVKVAKVEGENILMDMKSGVYHGLDPVATQVWDSLAEHGSVERAVEDLCRHFDVERERALSDVEQWIDELVEKGLAREERRAEDDGPSG